jgi:hypothetical protein
VTTPTVSFTRMVPGAIPPMRADKAALGYMPTSAYQYCEAMRVASSHGWYLFPPADIQLRFNGADVFHAVDGEWEPLSFAYLPGFAELWDKHCEPGFEGMAPPFLRALPARGAVQVWSGWLISTAPGWNALVRPIANVTRSHLFHCYEGVVETDEFQPSPLFINLQLVASDVTITFPRNDPLFHFQPVQRLSYSELAHRCEFKEGLLPADGDSVMMDERDWQNFRQTIRTDQPDETHRLGDYGGSVRKRAKRENEG